MRDRVDELLAHGLMPPPGELYAMTGKPPTGIDPRTNEPWTDKLPVRAADVPVEAGDAAIGGEGVARGGSAPVSPAPDELKAAVKAAWTEFLEAVDAWMRQIYSDQ